MKTKQHTFLMKTTSAWHTFATYYLENPNTNLKKLQLILGHKSARTTLIYAKPTKKLISEHIEEIRI